MDPANRLRRWLLATGLAATVGCHTDGVSSAVSARGQAPPDPVAPVAPVAPTRPVGLGAPGPVVPDVQKVATTVSSGDAGADPLRDGIPQIKVVALVGASSLVTDQEVIEAVRQHMGNLNGLDPHARKAKEKEMYAAELRRIIERELVLDEMYARLKKNGKMSAIDDIKEYAVKATDHTLRGIRKAYGNASEEEFLSVLRTQGLTLPVIRRQLERQTMADEYIRSTLKDKARTPSLADLRDYYDRHPDEFKTDDRVKWLDIFISFNKHATPRAAYDHAEGIRQQAAAGADFTALAKQYDNGLAVGTNGVGVGSKRGEIQPPDVEPTVMALRPGEVSGLVETPAGYHIVKIAERDYAGVRPFDPKVQIEVREKLLKQFREVEYKRMIEELWRKGPVRLIDNP